jgi:hypothetical protein
MTARTPFTQEQKAEAADDAVLFMRELLSSVETLTGVAEQHGAATLADLMYLHAAIVDGGYIENHPERSAVVKVVRGFASGGERWMKYIKDAPTTTLIASPRTPEHQLVFDAMQPMEELGGPSEQDYIAIMQAVLDQIERSKLVALKIERPPMSHVIERARGSIHFIHVNRALDQIYKRYIEGKFPREDYIAILDAIKGDVETRIDNVVHNMREARFIESEERRMDEASDAASLAPR